MKTRILIIIGVIIMGTVPFATFAMLDRYENYLEQLEYEAQRIANEPKPGERSYIEPELKAKLEGVELDLREKVRQLHQGLPPSSYAVNLNHQTKEIEVIVENKQLIPKIEEMMTQYPEDISIVIMHGKFVLDEFLQDKIEFPLSEKSWGYLLSLPREKALDEIQEIYDKNNQFFMDLTITGFQDSYKIGEMPQFTVVQAGYGIPCNEPRIIISQNGNEKPHWDYRFVHSCPFFKDGSPILFYMNVPYNNRIIPPITEPGQYTITASSSYDSFTSKQFTVQESDFVYDYIVSYTKRGNSTGNTSLNIDLNDTC